jgi:hypothetical protein
MTIARGDPAIAIQILSTVTIRTVVLASILQIAPLVAFQPPWRTGRLSLISNTGSTMSRRPSGPEHRRATPSLSVVTWCPNSV